MPTLADLRKQIPYLDGLDDDHAVDFLQQAYYPDVDRAAIAAKLGVKSVVPAEKTGMLRSMGDLAVKGAQGVVGLGQSAVGLAGLATGGLASQGMRAIGYDPEATNKALGEYLSPAQQEADANVQAASGFVDTLVALARNPRAISGGIMESVPGILAIGGVQAKLAETIAVKAASAYGGLATEAGAAAAKQAVEAAASKLMWVGAGAEGAQTAGQQADEAVAAGRTYGQYALPALAAGAGTALIGRAAGKLMGDAETALFTGAKSAGVSGSLPARVAKSIFSEGFLEEMPQSAQEQVWKNIGLGKPWDEGVANQAATGLVTGGVMGGAMGALQGRKPQNVDAVSKVLGAQSVDEAAAAAMEAITVPRGFDADAAMAKLEAQRQADEKGLRQFGSETPSPWAGKSQPGSAEPTVTEGERIIQFSDRVLSLQEQLSDPVVRQKVRERFGDEGFNQAAYYATTANNTDINLPGTTRERMVGMAERILEEAQFQRNARPGIGANPITPPAALPAPAVPRIGLDTTPTGNIRVDAAGNAAPETRADVINGQQAQRTRQAQSDLGKQTPRGAGPVNAIRMPGPIPVGEATELPYIPAGEATELQSIPAGEASELLPTAEAVELPKRIPAGQATELPVDVIRADDLLTRDNQPYGSKMAAKLRASKDGGEVVAVQGGWAVRPTESPQPIQARPNNTRGFEGRDLPKPANVNQPDVLGTAGQPVADGVGRTDAAMGSGVADGRVATDARGQQPGTAPAVAPSGSSNAPVGGGGTANAALKPVKVKVFKSRDSANKARKESGNTVKIQKVANGFILRQKTDKEIAAETRSAQRLNTRPVIDREKDPLLTAIGKLGGLGMAEKADTIGEGNKLTPGGHVFTKTGQPIDIIASDLAELNYIPAAEMERDGGTTWLRDAIKAEHAGRRQHFSESGEDWMRQAQAKAESYYDGDPLAGFTSDELEEGDFTGASPDVQAATESLLRAAKSLGIDTEAIQERVAMQSDGLTEDEYHAKFQEAIAQAFPQDGGGVEGSDAGRAGPSGQDRGQAAGNQGGQEDAPEGLTLSAQTAEDLKAKADREEAAVAAERAKKGAEQERLRKDAEDRDNKARADSTVDDFQLGQDATRQMSGMGDMFDNAGNVDTSPKRVQKAAESEQVAAEPAAPAAATPGTNTIFTEDAAEKARAILRRKLGQLNSGLDPEMMQAGITLAGYHIEKGARSFIAYSNAMLGDLGDAVRPYLKSWYMAVAFDPRATGFSDKMDDPSVVKAINVDDFQAAVAPKESAPGALRDHLRAEIAANRMPKDNPALRKMVEAFDGAPPSQSRMKEAQEDLEAAIVQQARDIVANNKGEGDNTTFTILKRLYDSQPNLNIRTSTSIDNQAYSTPAPLAFLGARLADVTQQTTMYEPTGGNGMLAITAKPSNVTATELDTQRAESLKAQGINVTQGDALKANVPAKSKDRVMTNPPFGPIKNEKGESIKVKFEGYTLGQIDHLIAARALETMKDDGKATLIIGANKAAGQQSNNDLIFFNWLYGNYNVTSHFEVEGDLYQRQGAGWPVRVISINGRMKSAATAPNPATIQRANTWSEVYERFQQGMDSGRASARVGARSVGAEPRQTNDTGPVPGTVAPKTGRTDSGRPQGRPAGDGNVAGERAGPMGNRPAEPAPRLGEPSDAVGSNDQAPGSVEDAGAVVSEAAANAAGNPRTAGVTSTDPENQFQARYIARSDRKDEGVLIPVNMAGPTQDALNRLEDEVGNIDEFAAKELGYKSVAELHRAFMGLQVDSVASAISQIKAGKGIIIADQTGIGKGRQAAGIIRWAAKNGKTPIFVTVKPSLFTDMYGDLHDIGTDDIQPLLMNVGESIKGAGDERLFANQPVVHKRVLEGIASSGRLPDGRNALFMTYSQINVDNIQRKAVMALAPNAVFVLDESHNAGGASATGEFIKGALDLASGVTYLSATYAKRPDNMPVYFKTDIGEAVADDDTLMAAMAAGGLPLQTVVSNNLVKAGQMFRRERSYDGVNIESRADTDHKAEHVKLSDETTSALRAIVSADRIFHNAYVKALQKELEKEGSRVLDMAGNQAQQSVDHTQFSSVVHNFVRQMLLGLKAQEAANDAIRSIKRGEKPLIAVEGTMGSFLAEYAENNNIKVGDNLGSFDYRTVLSRALERSRYIVRQLPNGDKVKEYIPMGKLDPLSFAAYTKAQAVIDRLKIDIPVSPIDWMRDQITKAGYTVAEVTGRSLSVDYTDTKQPKLSQIDQREQKDKVRTTRQFNDGTLDAIILNVAGSTGISLHASEKFKDQRQRHMIVAQAAQDINIFMQMLGRVHRTGQVRLPKYTLLSADLPAEIRPTTLLSGKMKSLNANTSSNTESATSVKAADLLNKYGDQIVQQYLADNTELAQALDLQVGEEGANGEGGIEDIARKATGRLALMPVKTQEQFYAEVEEQYQALIDYLNKTNQNDLEPRTFDFDAQETKSAVLFEGQNKASPFGEDALYGEYSVKAQGKAMSPEEIRAAMAEHLDGKTPGDHMKALAAPLQSAFNTMRDGMAEKEQKTKADAAARAGAAFLDSHKIGSMFRVDISGESYNAIVTNIRSTHKATGNPFSLSKIQVTIAVNGALRSVTLPATQFAKIEVSRISGGYGSTIEAAFKEGPPNERETAKIVTGNLLGAYGEIDGVRGSIITFSKSDGTTEQGILLPKAFNFTKDVRQDYRLKTAGDVFKFLTTSTNENIERFGINSRDSVVRVLPSGRNGITIQVPKSKAKGGKYFLDKALREAAGDFVSSGSFMRAPVTGEAKAIKALNVLMQKGALYALPSMAQEARQIVGDTEVQPPSTGKEPGVFSRSNQAGSVAIDDAKAVVDAIRDRAPRAPQIIVHASIGEAPKALRDEIRAAKAESDVEAAYHDGQIHVFPQNIGSVERLAFVVAHHEIRHHGLRSLLGPKLGPTMLELWSNPSVKAAAQAKIDQGLANSRVTAVEEALADMPVEDMLSLKGMPRIIAAVRAWLRDAAGRLRDRGYLKLADMLEPKGWTDADVASLVQRAEDVSLRGGGGYRSEGTVFERQDNPAWYSALNEQVKAVPMKAGPAAAWKSMFKNWTTTGKVKADELEWSGLNEWLDMQGGKVTKDAISEFLAANGVKVTETVLDSPTSAADAVNRDFAGTGYTAEADEIQGQVLFSDPDGEMVDYDELPPNLQAIVDRNSGKSDGEAKYGRYQLQGGTNYREVLLTLPVKSVPERVEVGRGPYEAKQSYGKWFVVDRRGEWGTTDYPTKEAAEAAFPAREFKDTMRPTGEVYQSDHWDAPNVLAHIRVNDRVDSAGARTLFVEEIQSDWGQAAKKKGIQRGEQMDGGQVVYDPDERDRVPNAPFIGKTDAWVSLALKRVIKMAVDGGYDKVAFVTGEQSTERYDLSKQISAINYEPFDDGKLYEIEAIGLNGGTVFAEDEVTIERIEELVGKDMAKKIAAGEGKVKDDGGYRNWHRLSGLDLKVGGKGMRAFYDKIVPSVAKDVLRKVGGGQMESVRLSAKMNGVKAAGTGVRAVENAGGNWVLVGADGQRANMMTFESRAEAEAEIAGSTSDQAALTQPGFTITPQMRDQAAKGMAMFSRATPQAQPEWIASGSAALQGAAGKIDTYAPAKTMAEKARAMSAGWKQRLVQGMLDAYAPLKSLSMDAYIAARMTKSADGAFEGMLMYGRPVMTDDGGIRGDLDGKGFLGAMRDLGGEHDRFFMWMTGNRAERLLAEGKENLFTADEIAAMKALNGGTMADGKSRTNEYRRALHEFNRYSKSVLDVAEKSGLIDGESRSLWEHDFYVPFYRMSQENEISGPVKIKGLVRQKAFERLKGGKENLGDLMDNTLRNWSHLLSASLANVAASKSLLAAEQAGIAIEAKEAQAKEIAKAAGLKGNATYFMDQGEQRWFVVEDPAVLQAISSMEAPALNGLPLQLMAKFKKYLTIGVTIAPAFKVRNLIRDTLAAPASNEMSFNIAKNLAQGWGATNTKTDGYAQMLFSGGLMRFGTYLEGDRAENVKRLIAEGVEDKTILDTPQKVKAMLGAAWDAWQNFGDRLENVNRTALYQQLLDKGLTPREAAFQARDMMDFSLQGSWAAMRTLTAVVPFLNARAQGLYKLGRSAAENPKRMGYMVAAVSLASIALMLAHQDDDDWKAREDWDRDGWWWFKIGETAYRIPKPFELGAVGTIAERSLELAINDEMTGKRFAERMKQMVTDTFAINPVPQMFKPMLDLYANKDSFTGRQIETLGMERLSKPERYGPNTSALAKALGAAGEYTGVSPVQVDHMIRAYFGWLGTMGAATVDAATSPFSNIERPAKKMDDYFGGFVKELPAASSRYLEDFYKQAKETSEAMADLRRAREVGDTEKAAEIMEDRGDKIAQHRIYQQAERQLADLNKRIRLVRSSQTLDGDTKRQRLDDLTELRNRIARRVNDRTLAREPALQ